MKREHAAIASALRLSAERFDPYSTPRGHIDEAAIAVGKALKALNPKFRRDHWRQLCGLRPDPEEGR